MRRRLLIISVGTMKEEELGATETMRHHLCFGKS